LTVQDRGHGTERALEDRLIGSFRPTEALRFVSKSQMGEASFYVWLMLRRGPTSFVTREVSDRSGGLAATRWAVPLFEAGAWDRDVALLQDSGGRHVVQMSK
jgi:hypothetical protein